MIRLTLAALLITNAAPALANCASDADIEAFVAAFLARAPAKALAAGGSMEDALCTQAKQSPRRLYLQPRAELEALDAARKRLKTEEGRLLYAQRAGVEGTLSQGVRGFGARRSRYRGLAKTHLQQVMTAVAMNIDRIVSWLVGRPLAATRTSRFAELVA